MQVRWKLKKKNYHLCQVGETVKDWIKKKKRMTLGGKKHGSLKKVAIKIFTLYYTNVICYNTDDVKL